MQLNSNTWSDRDKESLAEKLGNAICAHSLSPVNFIDLYLTEDCNLGCPYCFVHGKTGRHIDMHTAREAVDFLFRYSGDAKNLEILFIGGEPLLNFRVLKETVAYGRNKAKIERKTIAFNMTTNGTLLDEEMLRFLCANGIPFLLSIDGGKETQDAKRRYKDGKGTFEDLKAMLPMIKRYQAWLGVRMTPTPETAGRLVADVKELFTLGANQFIIGAASGIAWPDAILEEYLCNLKIVAEWYVDAKLSGLPVRINQFGLDSDDEAIGNKKWWWGCGAGRGGIRLSVDGKLQACAKVQGLNNLAGLIDLGDVWKGFTSNKDRIAFTAFNQHLREPCMDCQLASDCIGGCPAVNAEATGSPFLPDPMECKLTKISLMAKAHAVNYAAAKLGIGCPQKPGADLRLAN